MDIALSLIAAITVVAALHVARAFFVPLALALGFHALLRPLVRGLERVRIPTPLGAAIVVLGCLVVGVTAAWSLSGPVAAWVDKAPASFANARAKLSDVARPLDRLTDAAVGRNDAATPGVAPAPPQAPSALLARLLGGATALLLGLAEVIVLLYLMLAGGNLFLRKFGRVLQTSGHGHTARDLLPDTESIVARYLALTAVLNVCLGSAVGLAMWAIGMPDPLVWGLLTFALEFIPYLGGATMVALLLISSLAAFPHVGHALLAPAAYLVLTTLENNVVSSYVYSGRLKLNPLAVIVSISFWWFIWGVAGVFLAVPITATLKALGDQIPRLTPLAELLGE